VGGVRFDFVNLSNHGCVELVRGDKADKDVAKDHEDFDHAAKVSEQVHDRVDLALVNIVGVVHANENVHQRILTFRVPVERILPNLLNLVETVAVLVQLSQLDQLILCEHFRFFHVQVSFFRLVWVAGDEQTVVDVELLDLSLVGIKVNKGVKVQEVQPCTKHRCFDRFEWRAMVVPDARNHAHLDKFKFFGVKVARQILSLVLRSN